MLVYLMLDLPSLIHFDWSLNVGNVTVILFGIWLVRKLLPFYRLLVALNAEHEMLLEDYAERHGLSMEDVKGIAVGRVRRKMRTLRATAGK